MKKVKMIKNDYEGRLLKEMEMKREQAEPIKGIKELSSEGGIEEAAAVFSAKGMEIFYNMFISNPVEDAIIKVVESRIPDIIEKVIEDKMKKFMSGYISGMVSFSDSLTKKITDKIELQVQETLFKQDEVVEDVIVEEPIVKKQRKPYKRESSTHVNAEANILINYLKQQTEPILIKQIVHENPEINWGVNKQTKMKLLMKRDTNIKKIGRGYYKYED